MKILSGGEALSVHLARELMQRGREVWNLYGPTETTIWSSVCRIDESSVHTVPIGHPIRNTRIYVLDQNLEPVPPGVSGEICIGGEGVARGYWNRPDLTSSKFISDPILTNSQSQVFRTGDRGLHRPDGTLECSGRADSQVKIRGIAWNWARSNPYCLNIRLFGVWLPFFVKMRRVSPAWLPMLFQPRACSGIGELRDFLRQKLPET